MRTGLAGLVIVSTALLMLMACSNSADSNGPAPAVDRPTPTTSASDKPTSAPPDDAGPRIEVIETEYAITPSRTDLTAGKYTFVIDNLGRLGHDFVIKGPGVEVVKRLPDGGRAEIITTLQPGTYELWCDMDDHRARGMLQTVTVTG